MPASAPEAQRPMRQSSNTLPRCTSSPPACFDLIRGWTPAGRGRCWKETHRIKVLKRIFELQQLAKVNCDTTCDTSGGKISRLLETVKNSLLTNRINTL
jgi:hypothetical protein